MVILACSPPAGPRHSPASVLNPAFFEATRACVTRRRQDEGHPKSTARLVVEIRRNALVDRGEDRKNSRHASRCGIDRPCDRTGASAMSEVQANAAQVELDADPLVGTVINGRFRIVRQIARGGMSRVYFATQAPLGRPVAVKVLRSDRDVRGETGGTFGQRFLQEAGILAKL